MKAIEGQFFMGWRPDLPDYRDYTLKSEKVQSIIKQTGLLKANKSVLPKSTDLRAFCSPVEDQEDIGSCTANAGVGMIEYFQRKAYGKHLDASRLFLYKATRNLMNETGDTGAYLRTTMEALALFGAPPEEYWPYKTTDFDKEPPAFCYAFGQNYQAIKYIRLDPAGMKKTDMLEQIKSSMVAGLPAMFGFTVYSSIRQAGKDGKIPFPEKNDSVEGGHAIMAVGYDDGMTIKHNATGQATKGAFLIRNSWGTGWGDNGYGWLPYEYLLNDLAVDWWTVVESEWIDTGLFKI